MTGVRSISGHYGGPSLRIKANSESVNMGESVGGSPRGGVRIRRHVHEDSEGADPEPDQSDRVLAPQEFRVEPVVVESADEPVHECAGPPPVRAPLSRDRVRRVDATETAVLGDGHEPGLGKLSGHLSLPLPS